ncbi:MAG: hypothetical protein HUU49_02440 [Candidatus Buchananbacteria bacterium]|nr:hypothetical protein [Candidatus Buchananbacteria bacterium]
MSILVSALVFYLALAKVVIVVTPSAQTVNQEFVFNVKDRSNLGSLTDTNIVPGRIKVLTVSGEEIFPSTGAKSVESDILGEVTIVNNYTKEQSLVRTTRLAAAENPSVILLRLDRTVSVGPGQKIKVPVYPEDPENFKEIKPTKLIMPGLWGPLQEQIYAEVENTLRPGGYQVSVVTDQDLTDAEKKLRDSLFQKALNDVNDQLEAEERLWPKLVSSKVGQTTFDSKVGDEISEFKTSMNLETVVVVFDESRVMSLAREKLKSELPSEKQLLDLDPKSFNYQVEQYNVESGEASVKVSLSGSSIISELNDTIDKSELGGMTSEEVQAYFSQFSEIQSVTVEFHPAWLKKIPRIKDKIEIIVGQ